MPLTYKYKQVKTVTEERQLKVPTRWGMYTSKGNKRLTAIAQKAYDKIEKLVGESAYGVSEHKVRPILVAYIVSWIRAGNSKSYGEASDTDVREQVGSFHDRLYTVATGDDFGASDAWERHLEEAYAKVWKH